MVTSNISFVRHTSIVTITTKDIFKSRKIIYDISSPHICCHVFVSPEQNANPNFLRRVFGKILLCETSVTNEVLNCFLAILCGVTTHGAHSGWKNRDGNGKETKKKL